MPQELWNGTPHLLLGFLLTLTDRGEQEQKKIHSKPGLQIWVVIHMCMEAMLRIFLYSFHYLKLAKTSCLSYYCYVSSSAKLEKRAEQGLPGSEEVRGKKEGVGSRG
jgi:hypothetical protein